MQTQDPQSQMNELLIKAIKKGINAQYIRLISFGEGQVQRYGLFGHQIEKEFKTWADLESFIDSIPERNPILYRKYS